MLALILGFSACDDLTRPDSEGSDDPWFLDADGALPVAYQQQDTTGAGWCGITACTLKPPGPGGMSCACSLDGIGVNVPGGPGTPPPEPLWPEGPGYPHDPASWPDPPGNEPFPNFPPPGPGECDPYAIYGGCFFTPELDCDVGVTRGSTGKCTFTPPPQLDYIAGWTFRGDGEIDHAESWTGTTWEGVLIESGDVRVDFVAGGREQTIVSRIGVKPRSTGIWTQAHWESKLDFVQGQGSTSCGPARPVSGVAWGWTGTVAANCMGQRIEPVQPPGWVLDEVTSGPNSGGWYVSTSSYYFKSTSQLSPGIFPAAPGATLTNPTQQSLCRTALGLPPGSPVTINFWDYNNTCAQVAGWSGFVQAAWDHEEQHFTQAETELKKPGNNIYLEIEDIVQDSESGATQEVSDVYNTIQAAASAAGGSQPTGNWSTPFWIWQSLSSNVFLHVTAPSFQRREELR